MCTTVPPRCFRLVLIAFALLLTRDAAAENTWREIRSPHFRVLTDASEHDGRMVASEFEQMRYVFVLLFKREQIESGAPLTIIAARNSDTFSKLEPVAWKASNGNVAGLFRRGWEKQSAITRMDTWGDQNQVVIYHEYAHSILHANAHWLPTWLDEGLAEFYGYTHFEQNRILVGYPSRRMGVLKNATLIPVSTMLTTRNPLFGHDDQRAQLFYAESWAMVHYMQFGFGDASGSKLLAFLRELGAQVPEEKAFRDVYGDPKAFQDKLSQYVTRFTFQAGVLPVSDAAEPASFTARQLTPAEVDYELGTYYVGSHQVPLGRPLLEKAIAADPKLGGVHEELGFLDFDAGKDDEARVEWSQAAALDPSLFRSRFALLMSGKPLAEQTLQELVHTREELAKLTQENPRFAPPFVELALTEWRLGDINQAYKDSRTAENIEPWRSGYRLLTGRILLKGKQPQVAGEYSRYIANHWFGSDHNEAVDLWTSVPVDQRGDGPALVMEVPEGTQMVRGSILEVACSAAPGGVYTARLQPDFPAGAPPLTLTARGGVRVGFTDTLWFGEDHFSSCHHLAGQSALAMYKPDGTTGGTLVELEVRDRFPDAEVNASTAKPAAAKPSTTDPKAEAAPASN